MSEADEVIVRLDDHHPDRVLISVRHGNYGTSLRVSEKELARIREAIDTYLPSLVGDGEPQPARWRDRWRKMRDRKVEVEAENTRLRAALDDLNGDVEEFLNLAHQAGHEAAKSWLIRAQRQTIAAQRARLRELEARS